MKPNTQLRRAALIGTAALLLTGLNSCVSSEEVVYLRDAQYGVTAKQLQSYQTTIQKNDELSITVSSKQPELVVPFTITEMGDSGTNNSNRQQKGYLVDANGNIVLPVIGTVHAAGKTCSTLGKEIANRLRSDDYIKDAAVNVRIINFKFSVLGEVAQPGVYSVDGERITILEALAKAGDLTIDGNRDVTIIREKNGKREMAKLDLRSTNITESPYYYLQQNDVIYVTPNDKTINTRSETMQIVGWTASGVGLIAAIVAICCI